MEAIILLDFGMIGTAAECLYFSPDEHLPVNHFRPAIGKVPTELIYNNGEVIAWGLECQYYRQMPITRRFKTFMGLADFSVNSQPTFSTPESVEELEKWITDYLSRFCSNFLDQLLEKLSMTIDQLKTNWYLTTPGCWDQTTHTRFQFLAATVLHELVPETKVIADISESQASCESLADHFRLPNPSAIIVCDIGGATCDTAFAVFSSNRAAVPKVFPIASEKARDGGTQAVDRSFVKCKVSLPLALRAEIGMSRDWQSARQRFDGSEDTVTMTLTQNYGAWDASLEERLSKGLKILITSNEVEKVFKRFLAHLVSQIHESLDRLKVASNASNAATPAVIALCGGGGTMPYVLKQLELYFKGSFDIQAPLPLEESRLATVNGHRIFHLRRINNEYLDAVSAGISQHKFPWQINWEESWRNGIKEFTLSSEKAQVKNYFVVCNKNCDRPQAVKFKNMSLEQRPGVAIWHLDVALSRTRTYIIRVTCSGRGQFAFEAHDKKNPDAELKLDSKRLC